MHDKIVKIQNGECDVTMKPGHVANIGDFGTNNLTIDTGDNNTFDTDDLMIAQSKAQIRSDYRRSLGKEFMRRLK